MKTLLLICAFFIPQFIDAAEWKPAGVLGNSGGSGETLVTFGGQSASGIGPILDDVNTIWERGGSKQLNRYALDGRLLQTFEIPESTERSDQLARVGDLLVLKLGKGLYRLPLDAAPGVKPVRIEGSAEVMSSSAFEGRVAVYDKSKGGIVWLDPTSGERSLIVEWADQVSGLHVGDDGTVYGFGRGQVHAWKDGKLLDRFPIGFNGERPQKIGKYWYSHSWHGTINRMNESFEPDPGVVLGGASGSFIGYLPQSADLTNGRGMVRIGEGLFAVSGLEGIVQLLAWNGAEQRFELARRIGPLAGLRGVALDAEGTIWTPRGSWRWSDHCATPNTLGDKEPDLFAQPIVLDGKQLCLLKKHYSYVQLAKGPFIDASGWSHFDTKGISDFELPDTLTAAVAVKGEKGLMLVAAESGGKAFQFGITADGGQRSGPEPVGIPELEGCTSMAWFEGRLLAAVNGGVNIYKLDDAGSWELASKLEGVGDTAFVHSDGARMAVSDTGSGAILIYDSLDSQPVKIAGLNQPQHLAISGDRLVVYESGLQQLRKYERVEVVEGNSLAASVPSGIRGKHDAHNDTDFQEMGRPGGIPFAIALSVGENGLSLSVKTRDDEDSKLQIGVSNERAAYLLDASHALESGNGRYSFLVPAGDWSKVRLAAAVQFSDQRERFGFRDAASIHAPFNSDPASWEEFDLAGYREKANERKQEIRIAFEQPVDGKATIVIEDSEGGRVRNLVSGRAFAPGNHTVVWDGLDEEGQLVAPGSYRWRGIVHPGIKPVYKMNFSNGGEDTVAPWGPNHSTLHDAVSNGKYVFFAAPVTEGGWALMALDADGRFVQGYEHQHGLGILHDAIAVDDQYLYCAQDGFAWGGTKGIDFGKEDWKATWTLSVVRYEIESGKMVEFPGKKRFLEVDTMEVGPGSDHKNLDDFNLGGLAVKDGKLYVGSRNRGAVLVLDAETGEEQDAVVVKGVRHLAAGNGDIYAAADSGIIRLGDRKQIIAAGQMDFNGIAVADNGDVLVSDGDSHQVRRFSPAGEELDVLGVPGGPYKGVYDPNRMVNPAGLAFGPEGKLWVTENRWNPKRVMAWDLEKGAVVYEKFGMPHYGGDGSGFDPENPRRWIGLGCFWDVDIEKGTAKPTHIISMEEGHFGKYHPHSYLFFREAGRTFLCARGKIALISEVLPDGTIRDIAATAGTHHFGYGCNWEPPQSYIDAFYEKWPEKRAGEKPGQRKGEGKPWSQRGMGVLWVDRNGDGEPQKDEFDFCGDKVTYGDGSWGHMQASLTLYMPAVIDDQVKIVAIAPKAFLQNGTPDYPTLDEALASAMPVDLTPGYKRSGVPTIRDHSGRFIFNSDPEMNAYARDGRHLWTYPNEWSNVHGSHNAPLPEPGVMQGTLGILGLASFDEQGEVFFMNGNHGRCFLLTTDGLYLDEAFVDVRVSYLKNEYRLGGEIFGGSFGRSGTDGKYYVQIGHGPYRIYELTGFDQARRISGSLDVTGDQIAAAEIRNMRQAAERLVEKKATVPGKLGWDKSGRFKAEVELDYSATHLILHYRVEDPSPWVNNGRDWTKLFATGDSVDFQFATDANADSKRRAPVPGDKRLLIAAYEGKPIAVLYEHRKSGGENPIEFTSPWRGEKVDNVVRLENAVLEVKVDKNAYQVIAKIPLEDVGMKLSPGETLRTDFGVTYGDAEGTDTNLRSYWSNQSTGLVDDIPGEIMLSPALWGEVRVVAE